MNYVTIGKMFNARKEVLFDFITSQSLLEFGLNKNDNFMNIEVKKIFKNDKEEVNVKMKVTNYIENEVYSFKTLVGYEHITSTYIFLDRGDKTKLIYKEEITSKKKMDNLNNKLVTFISKRRLKKRLKSALKVIENNLCA